MKGIEMPPGLILFLTLGAVFVLVLRQLGLNLRKKRQQRSADRRALRREAEGHE